MQLVSVHKKSGVVMNASPTGKFLLTYLTINELNTPPDIQDLVFTDYFPAKLVTLDEPYTLVLW